MAILDYEESLELARPVFLYKFILGTKSWRYASSATDVLLQDGTLWHACAISHDGVKQTGDATVDALTIDAPVELAPAQVFLANPPSKEMTLLIYQKDVSDPEVYAIYSGECTQFTVPEYGKVHIVCETISVTLRREGLRFGWQRGCPYSLYDERTCMVPKASHGVVKQILAINGNVVTVDIPDTDLSRYPGGFLEWTHPVKGTEYLGIESAGVSNGTITTFGYPKELYVGQSITMFRGCARTPAACQEFGNFANYGGVPNMPGKSPFDGNNPFY